MSRLGGVKGWAREWRQQGEGAVGREGLSPRFWPWKSCAHHQWISGIILLLPILITTMYLSKYLQACKMALGSWGWHSALTLGTCWSGPSTPPPHPRHHVISWLPPLPLRWWLHLWTALYAISFTLESHTDSWGNCKKRTRRLFKGRKEGVLVLF